MAIYTKFGKQETVEEFLAKLYSIREGTVTHATETYSDESCSIVQCMSRKLRSFDDIFECVQTYYPDITPKKLIHYLLTLNIKSNTDMPLYLYMRNCSDIKRIRIYYFVGMDFSHYRCDKLDSKWSWIELLEMLGLKSELDIRNYIQQHKR